MLWIERTSGFVEEKQFLFGLESDQSSKLYEDQVIVVAYGKMGWLGKVSAVLNEATDNDMWLISRISEIKKVVPIDTNYYGPDMPVISEQSLAEYDLKVGDEVFGVMEGEGWNAYVRCNKTLTVDSWYLELFAD